MAVQKALNKDSQLMTLLRANSMKELNAATATNAVVTGEATVATETFTTAEKQLRQQARAYLLVLKE
jgi:hypothetical protein